MRVLLDECLDWRLCRELRPHHCFSVHEMGWQGLQNGELLERAADKFDVFLTSDRNLSYQQNLRGLTIALIVVHARSTQLKEVLKLVPRVLAALEKVEPGQVISVD